MEYTEKDFIKADITSELTTIKIYLEKINEHITKYKNKSENIDEKILSLSQKQYLDINSSLELLRYQQNLIKNEKNYLNNLNNIYLIELKNQMYKLSEKTTFMYMSLQNINKDINKDPNMEKSIKRSFQKDDYSKIIEDILFNFSNIKILLLQLKEFNIKLNEELKDKNLHCKTLDHNIHKKRILIFINYQKLFESFITIIKYFSHHAETLVEKLNDDKNYIFLVNSKSNKDVNLDNNIDVDVDVENNIHNNIDQDQDTENETSDDDN